MNIPESFWRRVLNRPTPQDECSARRDNPPELGTAQTAGGIQRLDARRLTIGRKVAEDGGDFSHDESAEELESPGLLAVVWILIGYRGQTFPTSRNVENGVYLGGLVSDSTAGAQIRSPRCL